MNNLAVRSLVALAGIPLLLLLSMAGGFYFFGLIAVLSTLGLYEFYVMAHHRGSIPQVIVGMVFGLCVNAAFFWRKLQPHLAGISDGAAPVIATLTMSQVLMSLFVVFVVTVLLVELFRNRGSAMQNVGTTLLGVCYVSLSLGSLLGVRELFVPAGFHVAAPLTNAMPPGAEMIYRWGGYTIAVLFASIWLCDSAAYFVGLGMGRRKIFPRVSPNKTWEGAIAGCIAAILAFMAGRLLFLPFMSWRTALVFGVIVGVFGQLGDMVESLIKRDAGVKDSSGLIPGHGGVLDRFDSLILVSPLLFLYLSLGGIWR